MDTAVMTASSEVPLKKIHDPPPDTEKMMLCGCSQQRSSPQSEVTDQFNRKHPVVNCQLNLFRRLKESDVHLDAGNQTYFQQMIQVADFHILMQKA
jgi:hypothetical protein